MEQSLTQVPYIGEATEKQLRRRLRGSRPTSRIGKEVTVGEASRNKQITRYVLDARQQRALAEESSFMPERSARQQQTSTTPDPSGRDTITRGDFRVGRDQFKEAREFHDERSAYSQEQDEERRARITTDLEQWKSDPDSFDYPGVDTPNQRKPRRQEKDRGVVDEDDLLRPFDDEDGEEGEDEFVGI